MLRFIPLAAALVCSVAAISTAAAQSYRATPYPYRAGAYPAEPYYDIDDFEDVDPPYSGAARELEPRPRPLPPLRSRAPEARDWADDERPRLPPLTPRGNAQQRREALRPPVDIGAARGPAMASLLADAGDPEARRELEPRFRRQLVAYVTKEPAGTIVIDTARTYLYYVLGDGQAIRYGIGVGREGFTWSGRERVSRMSEWPDWHPPADMLERQPYLPRFMAGGPGNPLGARALYLGKTLYRIHGTNEPATIGKFVSSGCIRMLNEDVIDLYGRVSVGTRVVVLAGNPRSSASRPR